MQLMMALIVGILFAGGTYLILRPNLIRVVMGLGLYSNAANLAMIAAGGYGVRIDAPFLLSEEARKMTADNPEQVQAITERLMDPLPPDIILTAIVISFAVGALFLTICYQVYVDSGSDNPEELPNE